MMPRSRICDHDQGITTLQGLSYFICKFRDGFWRQGEGSFFYSYCFLYLIPLALLRISFYRDAGMDGSLLLCCVLLACVEVISPDLE